MPLDKKMIGCQTDGVEHWVDERWLMAYAASLADLNPVYMDTSAGNVIVRRQCHRPPYFSGLPRMATHFEYPQTGSSRYAHR